MEGERKGEKHQCAVAPHLTPTGDLAATQAWVEWALNGHPNGDLLVRSPCSIN